MNKSFEKSICNKFFDKCKSERIYYELTNSKKRMHAIERFSHNSDKLLQPSKIYLSSDKLIDKEKVISFLCCDECYCICRYNAFDGKMVQIDTALKSLYSNGPYFIFNIQSFKVFLETEYNFSEHYSYLLMDTF